MSEVRKFLEYLLRGVPSGPIKNFSKFQEMSDRLIGFQMKNWGFAIRLSCGRKRVSWRMFMRVLPCHHAGQGERTLYKWREGAHSHHLLQPEQLKWCHTNSSLTHFYLIKHFSFKFKPISRSNILQGIQNFLATWVFLVSKLKLKNLLIISHKYAL